MGYYAIVIILFELGLQVFEEDYLFLLWLCSLYQDETLVINGE